MNTQKSLLRSMLGFRPGRAGWRVPGALILLLGASCQSLADDAASTRSIDAELSAPLAVSPAALTQPEPGAPAAEYSTRTVTLRLFGTQGTASGEEASAPYATLADTATWATVNYHFGDAVGRNLRIVAIADDGIELADSLAADSARLRLRAGEDLTVRLVEHRFDRVVLDDGAHQFRLHGGGMAALLRTHGLGATSVRMSAAFAGFQGLQLLRVDPQGALGRMGLASGDRLLAIAGQAATSEALAVLPERLAQPGVVVLTIARSGNVWDAAYVVQ